MMFKLPAQEVIATSGYTLSNSNGSISFTIGEGLAQTLSKEDKTLTQGFQQSNIFISLINEVKEIELSVSVFPNPTSDYLTVKAESPDVKNLEYFLIDLNGKNVKRVTPVKCEITFDVHNLKPGTYFLQIFKDNKENLTIMKKIWFILILLSIAINIKAQVPESFKYHAVLRNLRGDIRPNVNANIEIVGYGATVKCAIRSLCKKRR